MISPLEFKDPIVFWPSSFIAFWIVQRFLLASTMQFEWRVCRKGASHSRVLGQSASKYWSNCGPEGNLRMLQTYSSWRSHLCVHTNCSSKTSLPWVWSFHVLQEENLSSTARRFGSAGRREWQSASQWTWTLMRSLVKSRWHCCSWAEIRYTMHGTLAIFFSLMSFVLKLFGWANITCTFAWMAQANFLRELTPTFFFKVWSQFLASFGHFNPHEGTSEPVFGARSTSTSASNGSARMWCPKSSLVLMPCNQRTLVSLWLLRLKAKCLKSVVPRGRTQMIVLARRSARALVLISRGCGDGSLLDPWQFWSTGLIGVSPSLIDTKSEYASSMWGNGNSASAWLWRFWRLKKSGYSTCLQQELTLMNSRNESKLDATWIFVGNSTAVIHKGFSFNSDGFVFTV